MSQLIEAQRAQHFDRVQVGNLPFSTSFSTLTPRMPVAVQYSKYPVFEGSHAQPGRLAHIPTSTPFVSLCPLYMRMTTLRFTVPG